MHDDDGLNDDFEKPGRYLSEDEWEKRLVDNEKVMDKYEKIWTEEPDRKWEDVTDLYMKVHHGIDLGSDFKEPDWYEDEEPIAPEEPVAIKEGEDLDGDLQELARDNRDDVDEVEAYRLAFEFGTSLMELMKKEDRRGRKRDEKLLQRLCFHGLRIAADISGGHGLGYEEDTLCGNIVKNRWALKHLEESVTVLKQLIDRRANHRSLLALLNRAPAIRLELQERISQLRSRVWW